MKCSICNENHECSTVKITDKNETKVYCLNCLLSEYLDGNLRLENNPDFVDDITNENGAVKYESEDESYVLEKKTLGRLISCNLDPDEYFALVEKYSADNFSLHDDFYDPDDGFAIQPVVQNII